MPVDHVRLMVSLWFIAIQRRAAAVATEHRLPLRSVELSAIIHRNEELVRVVLELLAAAWLIPADRTPVVAPSATAYEDHTARSIVPAADVVSETASDAERSSDDMLRRFLGIRGNKVTYYLEVRIAAERLQRPALEPTRPYLQLLRARKVRAVM